MSETLAINGFRSLVLYGFELKGVSEASRTAQNTLVRVFKDLNTLCRLFHDHRTLLSNEDADVVQGVICDAREVITKMANSIKGSVKNVDKHGTVTLYRRIVWTVRDGDSVKLHQAELTACQISINTWVTRLDGRIHRQNPGVPSISITDDAPTDEIWQGGKTVAEKQASEDDLHNPAIWKELLEAKDSESPPKRKRKLRRSHSSADEDRTQLQEAGSHKRRQQRPLLSVPCALDEPGVADDGLRKEFATHCKEDDKRRGRKRPEERPTLGDGLLEEHKARTNEDAQRRTPE